MGHARALEKGEPRPFSKLVFCNIGNPQELRQHPITFLRQVLSLVTYPHLLDDSVLSIPGMSEVFPSDAVERAKHYMLTVPGGSGAYCQCR